MAQKKILLDESEIPRQWYNIMADIKMNPPIKPDGSPLQPDDLAPVFPMNLIAQETSGDRWIDGWVWAACMSIQRATANSRERKPSLLG